MSISTKTFIIYLVSAFSVAILSALYLTNGHHKKPSLSLPLNNNNPLQLYGSNTDKTWPELKAGWRLGLATVIGFLGSAFGTVGGVGGGGIFVPMLTLIIGFDTKSAAALSK
ncbi:sulfite exporter TauE/SafE family protein, partial [Trifolium pratense]